MGEGLEATVTMFPSFVDFSTVLVGSKAKKELTLTNNNNCTLNYSLSFRESSIQLLGKQGIHSRRPGKPPIRVEPSAGELPPRTSKVVTIIFCPVEHSLCTTKLECRLRLGGVDEENTNPEETEGQKAQNLPSCDVSGTGAFPSLQIADVRSSYLSTHQLWRQLNIEGLNAEFGTDPAAEEMSDSGSNVDIFSRTFKLDFGAIEYGGEPCDTTFLLENTQGLPVTWRMKFPNEYEVDVERWAENGILSESEVAIATILDHNIFALSHKTGTLNHGEAVPVTVTYTPILVGLHELPVLVEFSNGKKMAVTFICRTLRNEDPYLHIYEPILNMVPMPIGGDVYPVQYYELYNAGPGPISFKIDPAPLEKLKSENMNCDVVKCDVVKGDIAGGSRFLIPFIFQPLEEKTYEVQLDIETSAGENHSICVKGQGHLASKDINVDAPKLPESTIPKSQKYQSTKQIACLSKEIFDFAYVPINCVKREILSIKNTSEQEIFFHWDISNPTMAQILSISPPSGLLMPDQSVILSVTYKPGPIPSVHDFDIICTLGEAKKIMTRPNSAEPVGEVLLAQSIERPYASRGNMKTGLSPRKHQSVTTRTTKSFLNRTFMSESKASGKSSMNRTAMESALGQDAVVYSRSFPSPVAEVADESGSKRYQINSHNYPLHLRLRAVALTVSMYKQLHSDYSGFFSPLPIPGPLIPQGKSQPPQLDVKQLIQVGGSSLKSMITDIISELVMEGVNDPSIEETYDNLPDEPVPYYVRIRTPSQLLDRSSEKNIQLAQYEDASQRHAVLEKSKQLPGSSVVPETTSTKETKNTASARPLLRDPIFTGILENIFENAIYSLIREIALEDDSLNLRKPTTINIPSS